jgi:hypothetical protein
MSTRLNRPNSDTASNGRQACEPVRPMVPVTSRLFTPVKNGTSTRVASRQSAHKALDGEPTGRHLLCILYCAGSSAAGLFDRMPVPSPTWRPVRLVRLVGACQQGPCVRCDRGRREGLGNGAHRDECLPLGTSGVAPDKPSGVSCREAGRLGGLTWRGDLEATL